MKDEPISDEKLDQLVGGNYRALGGISMYRLVDRLARELQATRTRQVEREQEVVRDIAAALAVPVSSPDGHEDRRLTYAEAIEWVASRSRAWSALLRRMEVADPRWLAQWRGQRWREGNGASSPGQRRWRIGQSYGIHVYEQSDTTPDGDRPVATFSRPDDAAWVVSLVNQLVGPDLDEQLDAALATDQHQIVHLAEFTDIYDEIRAERERAHLKHGVTSMESAPVDEMYRSVILSEEIGEVSEIIWMALWAQALSAAGGRVATVMNDGRHAGQLDLAALRKELVQVATMAAAWADRIPRGQDHSIKT